MSKSIERVRAAAHRAGLEIEIRRMGASTRTAEEAARQCGCDVAQIVKSMIFEGETSGRLFLFLVAGDSRLDPDKAAQCAGETLKRADIQRVRRETGFAIGGVAPLGQPDAIPCFGDKHLLAHTVIWAAAGAPDAVFSAEPKALFAAAGAISADIQGAGG